MKHAREDYQRIQDPAGLIPEDEPVFLLRGQDLAAPAAVMMWAYLNKVFLGDDRLTKLAEEQAEAMRDWQAKEKSKPADLPGIEEENKKIEKAKLADRLVKLRVLTISHENPGFYYFDDGGLPYTAEMVIDEKLAQHLKANCMSLGFAIRESMEEDEGVAWYFCELQECRVEDARIRTIAKDETGAVAAIRACVEALEFGKYRWQSSRETFVKLKSKKPKRKKL